MIPHARQCRRPTPRMRQAWDGRPELWCPSCGRAHLASSPVPLLSLPKPHNPKEKP